MKIMLEFVTVRIKTGAGEYVRRVVYSLIDKLKKSGRMDVEVYVVYNSLMPIAYDDLKEDRLSRIWPVKYIDCKGSTIGVVADALGVDCLFVGCAQYAGEILGETRCRTICVLHDVYDEEVLENNLLEVGRLSYLASGNYLLDSLKLFAHIVVDRMRHARERYRGMPRMRAVVYMLEHNEKSHLVVVSEYTKSVALYHWNLPCGRVEVLYSPERVFDADNGEVKNSILKELVGERRKYFLLLGGGRILKNPYKAVTAFRRYVQFDPECRLLVVAGEGLCSTLMGVRGVYVVPYLSDGDLDIAMEHCHALVYPTFFEGFGYPPLEAMRHGKPVLCSNTTAMPEILGDAPIYFSPLYSSAIFRAMMILRASDYARQCEKSRCQYEKIHSRQECDLERLLSLMLSET